MEKKYYYHFLKIAGGPGSGVEEDNTKEIDCLETSPLISIGYRKQFLDSHTPVEENVDIDTDKIKYKGQENYVPDKLQKFLDADKAGETWMWDRPVDVMKDEEGNYHIIDGHHRGLGAIMTERPKLKVNIYTINSHTKSAGVEDTFKQAFLKKSTSDKDRERLNLVWGMEAPTQDFKERVELDAEKQRDRPEAFE